MSDQHRRTICGLIGLATLAALFGFFFLWAMSGARTKRWKRD